MAEKKPSGLDLSGCSFELDEKTSSIKARCDKPTYEHLVGAAPRRLQLELELVEEVAETEEGEHNGKGRKKA